MNISKLTFGQLWKLHHQSTLMRVTAAYHGALERYWNQSRWAGQFFMVSTARQAAPRRSVVAWEKLIAFLTSKELRDALRSAAGDAPVRVLPGVWSDLTFCYYNDVGGRDAAHSRAFAIRFFAHRLGVPANVTCKEDHFLVRVQTDPMGAAALRYHPGTFFSVLKKWCEQDYSNPAQVFWWVPSDFQGLVNPCLRPIRTPDEGAQRREILQSAGA